MNPDLGAGLTSTVGLEQGKFIVQNGKVSNQLGNIGLFDGMNTQSLSLKSRALSPRPALWMPPHLCLWLANWYRRPNNEAFKNCHGLTVGSVSSAALAGGPLYIHEPTMQPYKWDTSKGAIPVYTDGGPVIKNKDGVDVQTFTVLEKGWCSIST